ncbi:MAG: sporulation protein YqfD [Oscillospiraceae bacterium]|nr:sporulation protein YqfD [Oscillospiraceae bacterium]
MFDNLRGVITFSIFTAEPDKLINELKESSLAVRNMTVNKSEVRGQIYRNGFEELKEIARLNGGQAVALNKKGLIFTVKRYERRYGIAAGAALSLGLIFFLSNIVLTIEVYGNDTLSENQIISLLSDYNLKIGSFIPGLNMREIEREVLVATDELAWVGIRNTGCRVSVEVSEIGDYPEMSQSHSPRNIISARDAQIVDVRNLHAGMLTHMLGDGVKKGEVIISGVIETTYGESYFVHATGDVIGRYSEKTVFTQSYEDESIAYLEKAYRKSFYFFGAKIPLYVFRVQGDYEYDESLSLFSVFNLKIPAGIVYSEYKLYEIESKKYTPDEARELLAEKVRTYEKNFLDGEDLLIVDKEIHISENQSDVTAVVKYTLEGNISVPQGIMAKRY